tara:strand:- start:1895 stop:2239 length:345 start_codon:yes stop_codon:yes gene_type:complete
MSSQPTNILTAAPRPATIGAIVLIGIAAAVLCPFAGVPVDILPGPVTASLALPVMVGLEPLALAPCVPFNFPCPAVMTTWKVPKSSLLIVTVVKNPLDGKKPRSLHLSGRILDG